MDEGEFAEERDESLLERRGIFSLKALPGVGLIFGILLLGALATFVMHLSDLETFARLYRDADIFWLLAALILQSFTYGLDAAAWRYILMWYGIRLPLKSLTALALVQLYGNQAVPTAGVAGATLVAAGLHRRGVPTATALSVLFATAIAYLLAFQLLAITAILIFARHSVVTPVWEWTLSIFSAGLLLTVGGLLALLIYGKHILPRLAKRWHRLAFLADGVRSLPAINFRFAGTLAGAVAFQAAILVVDALTLWACTKAVGSTISVSDAFVAFILSSVTATLSPIPMGLGAFEAASTGLLHLLGARVEVAFAATVAFRIFTLWLPMIPGLILSRHELRRERTDLNAQANHDGNVECP